MKNSREMLVGILAAATAGVIIGMLIAPDKGENLRQSIRDTVGDWTKKLGDLVAEGKEQAKGLAATFEEEVDKMTAEEPKRRKV